MHGIAGRNVCGADAMSHLDELDLASFEKSADEKEARVLNPYGWPERTTLCAMVVNLACQVRGLIRAIRADGLDKRWHPERDALVGLSLCDNINHIVTREPPNDFQLSQNAAEKIVNGLHRRGYKIVKDAA